MDDDGVDVIVGEKIVCKDRKKYEYVSLEIRVTLHSS